MGAQAISNRLYRGWPIERALAAYSPAIPASPPSYRGHPWLGPARHRHPWLGALTSPSISRDVTERLPAALAALQ
jgi:hypothetical protein